MNEIVCVQHREATTTSLKVAEVFGKQHKNVLSSIETLLVDLPEKDRLNFQPIFVEDSYGRKQPAYRMNRNGFSLIAMRFTGKKALQWQLQFLEAFNRMEQALLNQQNLSWQQMRLDNKAGRRVETDKVAEFVEYATAQGSTSAKMYFMNITTMTNKALFLVGKASPKSFRNLLDSMQLSCLTTAEYIVQQALDDGIKAGLHYKDIYVMAKDRVEAYAAHLPKQRLLVNI